MVQRRRLAANSNVQRRESIIKARLEQQHLRKCSNSPLPVLDVPSHHGRRKSTQLSTESNNFTASRRVTHPKPTILISTEDRPRGSDCEGEISNQGTGKRRQRRNNAIAKVYEIDKQYENRIKSHNISCAGNKCSKVKKDGVIFHFLKYYFNRWKMLLTYMDSEHQMLFEILLWTPLVSMVLYILFVEGKLLYHYVE